MLLLPEGQVGEAWEPSKNQRSFGYRGAQFTRLVSSAAPSQQPTCHHITLSTPPALPCHLTNAVSTGDRSRATSTALDQFSGYSRLLRCDPVLICICSSLQSVTDQTTRIFVKPTVITSNFTFTCTV
jgi:hypothetical protein